MSFNLTLPDLEKRFLPPKNWKIKSFTNPETGHNIAYRTAFIDNAKAIVFCLPGLSEYSEKYIETTRFLNDHGYNIVVIDWAYQGLSTRFKENNHKRHSDGYEADLSDLHYLIKQEINSTLPHYMLVHSMGGHIGLRYMSEHPNIIQAASITAPMININALKYLCGTTKNIFSILTPIHTKYIVGGHDWSAKNRTNDGKDIFSSDLNRDQVHNAWCIKNPDLQVGSPTYKWLAETLKSICTLKAKETLQRIKVPLLVAYAGQEALIDNKAIKNTVNIMHNAELLNFENAKHEILMETDDVRDVFLKKTLELFKQSS